MRGSSRSLRVGGGGRPARPGVEGLEGRALLAVTFAEYPLATAGSLPIAIAVGPSGTIAAALQVPASGSAAASARIALLGLTSHAYTTYPAANPTSGVYPNALTLSTDGTLWYTTGTATVGIFNPTTGASTTLTLPDSSAIASALTVGPDGNFYVLDAAATGEVDVINPTSRAILARISLPHAATAPAGIVAGPDGRVWATVDGYVDAISPTTRAVTEYPLPVPSAFSGPIIVGPDGNFWFIEGIPSSGATSVVAQLATLNATTHVVTEFPTVEPGGISPGPDGQVWFTDPGSTSIGEINTSTHVVTEYAQPTGTGGASGIVLGVDNNLYFALQGAIGEATVVPTGLAAITGSVASDPAGAGSFLGGALAGRTVFLDLKGDGTPDPGDPSALTDALGNFTIGGVAAGTYTLRVATGPGEVVTAGAVGGLSVVADAGSVTTVGTIGIGPSQALLPLPTGLNPFGSGNADLATAEVEGLYRTILGRSADAAGLAAATAALKAGASPSKLAASLLGSTEYLAGIVRADYTRFLGRTLSNTAVASVVASLQATGTTEEALAKFLTSSPEYFLKYGNSPPFYVRAVYQDVLGRAASTSEVSTATTALFSGTTNAQLTNFIVGSTESLTRAVNGIYQAILGRSADAAGLASALAAIRGGKLNLAGLAASLAGSTEFAALAKASVG